MAAALGRRANGGRLPSLKWTDRLLGAALAGLALQEALSGHLGVQSGELFGRRAGFFPLLPPAALIGLWLAQAGAGLALAAGRRRRLALSVAAAVTALSLTQNYFNQKMFLLLALLSLALDSARAARAQLLLLYAASAVFKLRDGFASGATLAALFAQVAERGMGPALLLPAALAPWLAKLTIAVEAALPLALWKTPRAGAAAAAALHLGFALCLPGVWPFTFACLAVLPLFLPPQITLE